MKVKRRVSLPTFEAGQVWRMEGVTCHIGDVGTTLVHYKFLKGSGAGVPTSLSNKAALMKLLKTKRAVLVRG